MMFGKDHENQLAGLKAIDRGAIYVKNLFGAGGNDPGVSHLGGEIVSHNTTDARWEWLGMI